MKVALGSDHRGLSAKRALIPYLKTLGCGVEDFGCHGHTGVDYPDIAYPLAAAVAAQKCQLGVLLDCDGIGMNMVANKVRGVRAATAYDEFTARFARENHHCNIITIGADLIAGADIPKIVQAFLLATVASGPHARRVEKLMQIEEMLSQGCVAVDDPMRMSFA